MHLSDQELDLIRRNEMAGPEARSARAHLAECASCEERLRALNREESEMEHLLRLLDHEPPRIDVDAVIRRAHGRQRHARTLLAAGIAFLAVSTAAVAMPGSPVRQWLGVLGSARPAPVPQARQSDPGPTGAPDSAFAAGVSLTPDSTAELVFEAKQADGSIQITLSSEAELTVRPIGGSVGYSVRPEGVWVQNADSHASYEIVLPRDAPRVRIRVGEEEVFVKDGATIRTVAQRGSGDRYIVRFDALGMKP